ncbi:hypothetical protein ACQP3J_33110, partial [Escherichia coli]
PELQAYALHPPFLCAFGGSNPGLHACVARTYYLSHPHTPHLPYTRSNLYLFLSGPLKGDIAKP